MRSMLLAALLAVALPVLAQNTPAPAPAAAPSAGASADVPKHNCSKPAGEFPGNLASDSQKRAYQKDFVAYTDCLKKFVLDQQQLAEPHAKAANSAANEYNAAVKSFNEMAQQAKDK